MTTITQKKHYKTPHCVFISLEEEACVLSGSTQSIEEEIHEKQQVVFGLQWSEHTSSDQSGNSSIWGSSGNSIFD